MIYGCRRHVPAEESSLATYQIIGGVIAGTGRRPICVVFGIIVLASESSNMQEIVTVVQVPPNSQVC